ncbi:F-box protein CPR1-like [Humulus lupulus]|uniref:F-box protein CPR1-like n=1 Tax=Humulus lupulus TaxID=3486 RepID=UPI002B40B824|nr:F-box protein CPR1-like [Humulus lupulus]
MPYLNTDTISIILSHLPVKTLLQFKCVCKSWYSLIKSHYFITMHLNNNSTTHHDKYLVSKFPYNNNKPAVKSLSMTFLSHHTMRVASNLTQTLENASFLGVCDGLLCVAINECEATTFKVINPATKQSKVLIKEPPNKASLGSKSYPSYGFAFDSKVNDYKLIRVTLEKTEILTLRANTWRRVPMTSHGTSVMKRVRFLHDHWSRAVTKKALYWTGFRLGFSYKMFIIMFDLTSEEFQDIDLPKSDNNNNNDDRIYRGVSRCSVFRDCLSVTINHGRFSNDNKVVVWVMREDGVEKCWTKQYCFSMELSGLYILTVDQYVREGIKDDDYWPFQSWDGELDIFSTKHSLFENFMLHPILKKHNFSYRESLVPLS